MLVLTIKVTDEIWIGEDIRICFKKVPTKTGFNLRVGVDAPKYVEIKRMVLMKEEENNKGVQE